MPNSARWRAMGEEKAIRTIAKTKTLSRIGADERG
jgi:hypothetical protein